MRTGLYLLLGLVAGVLVGAFGTAIHRTIWLGLPVGLVVGLALTLSTALFLRAALGFGSYAVYAVGWIVTVMLLSAPNMGDNVLVTGPHADIPFAAAGMVWSYLGAALGVVAALLPPRWFRSPAREAELAGGPKLVALPNGSGAEPSDVARQLSESEAPFRAAGPEVIEAEQK